jgi:soluble lytic murein transglycosylase-like protein/TolA-binding protein/peptidoglycan/xylan/chitin deacetylase (PgdA/CDA1 family)
MKSARNIAGTCALALAFNFAGVESAAWARAELPPEADTGDAALALVQRLDKEGGGGSGAVPALSPQEHMHRASVYLANGLFTQARGHCQALIENYPADPLVPRALFAIGWSYYQGRRYAEALPIFKHLGSRFLEHEEGRDGFYYVAPTLQRLDHPGEAAAQYLGYARRFPTGSHVERAYLNAIDSYREAGRPAETNLCIDIVRAKYPGTASETNARFARLRLELAGGDWPSAVSTADALKAVDFTNGVETTKDEVAYLRAYSLDRSGQAGLAAAAYQAIGDRARSYYGARATARLGDLGFAGQSAAEKRVAAVRREILAAADAHPAPFRAEILKAIRGRTLDPRLVLSLMAVESGFNPKARSNAAARGLLQLTMDIVARYGAAAGHSNVVESDLYRPEINIAIGVEYLCALTQAFPDLPEAVAASFNGGEDNVARWLKRSVQKDPGVFVAEIGYPETKDYVIKVMANYRAYQQLYATDLNAAPAVPARPSTVVYDGQLFVSLPALQRLMGPVVEGAAAGAAGPGLFLGGKQWRFIDGGERVTLPGGEERPLAHALLVLDDGFYLCRSDAHSLFAAELSETAITLGKIRDDTKAVHLYTPDRCHSVEALSCEHLAIKLTKDVEARGALHLNSPRIALRAGGTYLCRRKAVIDGVRYLILTDAGRIPLTVAITEETLRGKFVGADLEHTPWQQRRGWFEREGQSGLGLANGDRSTLPRSISVTLDFCWSTHRFESRFLTNLPAMGKKLGAAPVTLFICGRWMDQHPTEMQSLLDLERQKGAELCWGLHSWVHPISNGFMNRLSPDAVREDTLRLERALLEWGVIPTVYYRFPALIHDPPRVAAILDLDLLPIDCDAWIAVQGTPQPFGHPTQDGSIVLLHGNGNEPVGIARFEAWLASHPDWHWKPLCDFLPQ